MKIDWIQCHIGSVIFNEKVISSMLQKYEFIRIAIIIFTFLYCSQLYILWDHVIFFRYVTFANIFLFLCSTASWYNTYFSLYGYWYRIYIISDLPTYVMTLFWLGDERKILLNEGNAFIKQKPIISIFHTTIDIYDILLIHRS